MSDPKPILRESILTLLDQRDEGKTICPSEAAREAFPENWRDHMEITRQVGIDLAERGEIEICQGGKKVSDYQFRGPIRLRKPIS